MPAIGSRIEALASTGVPVITAEEAMAARASTRPHGQPESKFLVVVHLGRLGTTILY